MSSNGYTRVVEVFEQNETAAQFLRDDGEGGFASGVERMAKEIERLRESARTAADRQQQDDCAGGWRKIDDDGDDVVTNDLTIAYLAGEADARDHYRAQIETLQAQLKLARIDADQQRARAEAAEAEVQRLASAGPIPGYWTREMMLAFAKGYDREAAAQIGEPDPWDREPSPFEKDWCDEAVACVTAGLKAVIMEGGKNV